MANICGICREQRSDLICLKFQDESSHIIKQLKRFVDRNVFETDPHLMRAICLPCKVELDAGYNFKLKCDKLNHQNRALCEKCGLVSWSLQQHMLLHKKDESQSKNGQKLKKVYSDRLVENHRKKINEEPSAKKLKTDEKIGEKLNRKTAANNSKSKLKVTEDESDEFEHKYYDFRCRYCNLSIMNFGGMKSHVQWHEIKKKKDQFKCPKCHLIFLKEIHMNRHIIDEHVKKVD